MKRFLHDVRLHPWPRVRVSHGKRVISVRVLTPWRMTLIHEFIRLPLIKAWKLTLVVLILDFLVQLLVGYSHLAWYLPCSRSTLLEVLGGMSFLHVMESWLGFPLEKALFGSRIKLIFKEDRIYVRGRYFREWVPRTYDLAFAESQLNTSGFPVYENAAGLNLILSDVRVIRIAEVYGKKWCSNIVANANLLLARSRQETEKESDPRSRFRG